MRMLLEMLLGKDSPSKMTVVAILSDGGNMKKTASYFADDEFEVFSITGDDDEGCKFKIALEEGKKRSPNSPLIIIKDTTISHYSPRDVATALKDQTSNLSS